jgi:prevent-host-death family protein
VADVSVYDARAGLSRLINRALAGEEVVITRKGTPVVRLEPIEAAARPRRLGLLAGEFDIPDSAFDPLPDELLEDFYGKEGAAAAKRLEREEARRRDGAS